ncbi:MAG TPA: hypothetical protein VES19_00900 [Candidatus Limnocylindrales bacterium]|nr:hypothetical protein [Candidatus Limnocylindrales bacterium]
MSQSASRRTVAAVLASIALLATACGAEPTPATPDATGSPASTTTGVTGGTSPRPSARPEAPLPADIPTVALAAPAGDAVASGEVTPEDGGQISGMDEAGAYYTLDVDPWSVLSPVTMAIRPLHGTTELGPIVAGADLEPAGLRLLRPARLTIEIPMTEDAPVGLATFDYRGDAATARARLVIGTAPEPGYVTLLVSHFSGSVVVDLGSGANELYDKWASAKGDDTPSGRQAAAEVRYAAADAAERSGRISTETAAGIRDRAAEDWITAERDRLATDPEMLATADGGRPEDLDALSAEIGRIIEFEARRAGAGDSSSAAPLAPVVEVLVRYENAITTKILNSEELGRKADSGRVSDAAEILDLMLLVAGVERQIQLLGGPEMAGLAKVFDLLGRLRAGLLRTCESAPVDPLLILGLSRMVQLLGAGSEISFDDIAGCAGLQPAPTDQAGNHRITGQITLDATTPGLGDHAHVVFDLSIVETVAIGPGFVGSLVFGPGSRAKVDWTLTKPLEGCPSDGTWTGTLGTMSNEQVDRQSQQNPDAIGLPTTRDGDLEINLALPLFKRGTGRYGLDCMFPSVSLACGYTPIRGRLVHANPYEWSFSCSSEEQGGFWSAGGRLLANW